MKTIFIIFICFVLVGCNSTPKKEPPTQIIKYKYVAYRIPPEILTIPAPVNRIDIKKATDKDVGLWIIDSERRTIEIEKRLKVIKSLQDKQMTDLKKMNPEDVEFH